jgi:hypothetical protein
VMVFPMAECQGCTETGKRHGKIGYVCVCTRMCALVSFLSTSFQPWGFHLMMLSNPHHLPKAPALDTKVRLSFHPLILHNYYMIIFNF